MAFLFWHCFVAVHTMLAVTILLHVRPSACLSIVISVSNVVESLFKIRFFCGLNWASFIWAFWSCQHTDFTNPSCVGNRFWTLVWLASSEGKPHFKQATTRKRQAHKFELKTKQPPLNVLVFMRYFSKPYLCGGFFWYVRLTI